MRKNLTSTSQELDLTGGVHRGPRVNQEVSKEVRGLGEVEVEADDEQPYDARPGLRRSTRFVARPTKYTHKIMLSIFGRKCQPLTLQKNQS